MMVVASLEAILEMSLMFEFADVFWRNYCNNIIVASH